MNRYRRGVLPLRFTEGLALALLAAFLIAVLWPGSLLAAACILLLASMSASLVKVVDSTNFAEMALYTLIALIAGFGGAVVLFYGIRVLVL